MDIKLDEISKVFSSKKSEVAALAPISFTVNSGEFICIIGPSGCGKSTLLRLVADQTEPSNGQIYLDNGPPSLARMSKAIAWMAQNPALLPWATVLENIGLPQKLNRHQHRPAPSPKELLNLMDLAEFADAYPGSLSGGMQQRVALARTLATGAPLWLMDEPFAALDQLTREILADEVLNLWETVHATVLWVTHNIHEAVHLADQVIVLTSRPGQIKAVVPITLPRPREESTPEVTLLTRRLRELLGMGSEKKRLLSPTSWKRKVTLIAGG